MTILDVTIDFETCALSANAAILQLAAVPFNTRVNEMNKKQVFTPDIPPFNAMVDLRSCVMDGFDFDKDTLKWWSEKPQALKDEMADGDCYPLKDVMEQFIDWLNDLALSAEGAVICLWSQGADFDIAILRNICKKYNLTLPVSFHNFRDARTFVIENISNLLLPHPEEGVADNNLVYQRIPAYPDHVFGGCTHNAIYDAARTSWNVAFTFKVMNEMKSNRK